jgi:UDP-N-acetylmuramyl pentapeptide phosphotransferase/UDP-N-acetylglucosamine-1-phosphate transferase
MAAAVGWAVDPLAALGVVAASGLLAAVMIVLLRPLMLRYALARPNRRSSHTNPTPQGGGIAVIGAVLLIALAALATGEAAGMAAWRLALLLSAIAGLALLGAFDDIRPLPVRPRLALQFACAAALVTALPAGSHALQSFHVPLVIERLILLVGLVWFINLTNFMDGIDWMTVVEVVPLAGALALAATAGLLPAIAGILALALLGAMLGFAPYNKHVARLFLGDVGSLAIGGLVGWMLIVLAAAGHLAAALILPLYYLADSMITLYRRWRRGERLSEAHRSHFYQLAIQRGFTVPQVTMQVLALNVLLAVLAWITIRTSSTSLSALVLTVAMAATGALLWRFERGRL